MFFRKFCLVYNQIVPFSETIQKWFRALSWSLVLTINEMLEFPSILFYYFAKRKLNCCVVVRPLHCFIGMSCVNLTESNDYWIRTIFRYSKFYQTETSNFMFIADSTRYKIGTVKTDCGDVKELVIVIKWNPETSVICIREVYLRLASVSPKFWRIWPVPCPFLFAPWIANL